MLEILSPEILSPEILSPEILSPEIYAPEIYAPEILMLIPEILVPEVLTPVILMPKRLVPHIFMSETLERCQPRWHQAGDIIIDAGDTGDGYSCDYLGDLHKGHFGVRCTKSGQLFYTSRTWAQVYSHNSDKWSKDTSWC
jgi:hypothetical protein